MINNNKINKSILVIKVTAKENLHGIWTATENAAVFLLSANMNGIKYSNKKYLQETCIR